MVFKKIQRIVIIKKNMQNFTAIDFETANSCKSSVCGLGAVVVREGKIVDKFYELIKPEPEYFDYFNTAIHGLTNSDVETADVFPFVWQRLSPKLGDFPLVAHNKAFDEGCLKACFKVYRMDYPDYEFFCTLSESRKQLKKICNHQLQTVAAYYGYDLKQHHNALADAEACAIIALNLFKKKAL